MENLLTNLTVEATINASVEKAWKFWTEPEHITQWNHASDDWHTPHAKNDLRPGGKFLSRMEAKDGSFGFDFEGSYLEVILHKHITYILGDGRKVSIDFEPQGASTKLRETFAAESTHSLEMQQAGWQAILDNFKTYAESHS